MPAGERARRRAERERQAAEAEAARQAEAERQARRTARRTRLTGRLPRSGRSGQSGTLAARKRQQAGLVVAFVIALNVLVFLATDDWAARAFFLLLCVLVAPIATTLLTRK